MSVELRVFIYMSLIQQLKGTIEIVLCSSLL